MEPIVTGDPVPPRNPTGAWRAFAAILAGAAALAGVEFYALWRANDAATPPHAVPAITAREASPGAHAGSSAPAIEPGIIGAVDVPALESVIGNTVTISGWALAPDGVRGVDVRVDGHSLAARYGISRIDVGAAKPGYPDSNFAGFSFQAHFPDLSLARHSIEIVAIDKHGTTKTLAHKSLIPPDALTTWRGELDARPKLAQAQFHFLMMTSGIGSGGAQGIDDEYRNYLSRTQRVGMAIPILYLRTTAGKEGDWRFDPDYDLTRKCGDRQVAEDNLAGVIRYAVATRTPVQFILNGGIWSDASCETPQWDLTDHLEEDPANCQWSQHDEVFPDNFLKGLPGSTDSPQLARSLTYNVYARAVRSYKRRNLQAVARIVAQFSREHPDLFVGVVLDADTYMNPFLRERAVFDYNPGMLRQFREWLKAAGPYAGRPTDGAPDLSAYRRRKPLTLAQVNAAAQEHWTSWNAVEPPRRLPGFVEPLAPGERPIWNDPWWNLWDEFRKHIVDLHYDELSEWVHAAGISRDRIFSAQGLVHDDPQRVAFALRISSHSQNYDSAGVSVEGAIPRDGHLGAVVYGHTARNAVRMENGRSLFASIGRMDNGWAIVEYNNTDLSSPMVPPDYSMAYQTFRDAFNYGAREVSAMAWNGSNGSFAGTPGYLPYTAWRDTPAEDAMRDFLVSHSDVPWGSRLWTFGTPRSADTDGWTAARGTLTAGTGFVTLEGSDGTVTLLSPYDQVIRPAEIDRLLLRFGNGAKPSRVKIAAQTGSGTQWIDVGQSSSTRVALQWPNAWRDSRTIVERLRVELRFPPDTGPVALLDVLLYPRATRAD